MLESPSLSDSDLLRLLSGGDQNAFLEFYRRHQAVVYRFALHMSGRVEIAEEVTQDVFMVVMRVAKQYDARRGSVIGYVYGIARNVVKRALERERSYGASDDTAIDSASRVAAEQDLLADLAHYERIQMLRSAVLALPPAYREAVVLCDLHEMDYSDAAGVVGCPVGTIRSRLHRARALLLEKMRAAERCPV
jgi:RNA polymerase sigma-70 factor (ECF subfamily)